MLTAAVVSRVSTSSRTLLRPRQLPPSILGSAASWTTPITSATPATSQHFQVAALDEPPRLLRLGRRYLSDTATPKQRHPKVGAKKKKKGGQSEEAQKSQEQKDIDNIIKCLDAPMRMEPPITAEEQERRRQIVRNYTIGRFEEHNEREHDLSCKIKMKLHAIKMLPNNTKLKKEALNEDGGDDPPYGKGFPMWTPPIPGFNPSDYDDFMEGQGEE